MSLFLFMQVVLLREGCVVYHGPKESIPTHFASLGFVTPSLPEVHPSGPDAAAPSPLSSPSTAAAAATSAAATGGMDLADWCTDMLNNPLAAYLRGMKAATAAAAAAPSPTATSSSASADAVSPLAIVPAAAPSTVSLPANAPISTEVLAAMWKASPLYAAQMSAPPSAAPLRLTSPWARQQFGHAYCQPYPTHLRLLLGRQFLLLRRNPTLLRSKLVGVIIMAIVLGGLYYQAPLSAGASLISLCLNLCMNLSFMNFAELASACESKYVAYKHTGRSLYPGGAFVLAGAIAHMPGESWACQCDVMVVPIYFSARVQVDQLLLLAAPRTCAAHMSFPTWRSRFAFMCRLSSFLPSMCSVCSHVHDFPGHHLPHGGPGQRRRPLLLRMDRHLPHRPHVPQLHGLLR